jgi:CRISPR-associated endoribonuclease Cas6
MLTHFAAARYRFVLTARTPLRLSAFAGATLRGGFGHVFKRCVCLWPPGDCPRCLLKNTCAYPYIFETAPPADSAKLRGLDQIPRPYVIEPDLEAHGLYQPGERLSFGLVLVGRALDYLPYFVFTFRELGRTGLGPSRGQFEVAEVHAEGLDESWCIYRAADGVLHADDGRIRGTDLSAERWEAASGRLTVQFLTPTRIRSDGVMRAEVSFQDLVRALLRRVSSLSYFHCGAELVVDFKGLIEQAAAVRTVAAQLEWQRQARFSGRQEQWIDAGGVTGSVVYEADNAEVLSAYWPLLAVGEWVHVGKGCVMGLGRYQMKAP